MNLFPRFLISLAFLACAFVAQGDELTGRVVRVVDGDTIAVLTADKQQHKMRLAEIDAPERGQPFGTKSKERLSELVGGKEVRVDWYKNDRWGRLIGTVWAASPDCRTESCSETLKEGNIRDPEGRDIIRVWVASPDCPVESCPKTLSGGLAMITSGLAWHFKRYAHEQTEEDRERYAFAEVEARAKGAGLWIDPEPVPPWEWWRR